MTNVRILLNIPVAQQMRRLYIHLDEATNQSLNEYASRSGLSIDHVVDGVINELVAQRTTAICSWIEDADVNVSGPLSRGALDAPTGKVFEALSKEVRNNISGSTLKNLITDYVQHQFVLPAHHMPMAANESPIHQEERGAALKVISEYRDDLKFINAVQQNDKSLLESRLVDMQQQIHSQQGRIDDLYKQTLDGALAAHRETLDRAMFSVSEEKKAETKQYSFVNIKVGGDNNKLFSPEKGSAGSTEIPEDKRSSWVRVMHSLRDGLVEGLKPAVKVGVVAFGSLAMFAALSAGSLALGNKLNSNIPTVNQVVSSFQEHFEVDQVKVNGDGFELTAKGKESSSFKSYADVLKTTKAQLQDSGLLKGPVLDDLIKKQQETVTAAILDGGHTKEKMSAMSWRLRALQELQTELNAPKVANAAPTLSP